MDRDQWREKKGERFDRATFQFASEFIAMQSALLREMAKQAKTGSKSFDQKQLGQMAQSVRAMQAVGKTALGAPVEKKQLELDLNTITDDDLVERIRAIIERTPEAFIGAGGRT